MTFRFKVAVAITLAAFCLLLGGCSFIGGAIQKTGRVLDQTGQAVKNV